MKMKAFFLFSPFLWRKIKVRIFHNTVLQSNTLKEKPKNKSIKDQSHDKSNQKNPQKVIKMQNKTKPNQNTENRPQLPYLLFPLCLIEVNCHSPGAVYSLNSMYSIEKRVMFLH